MTNTDNFGTDNYLFDNIFRAGYAGCSKDGAKEKVFLKLPDQPDISYKDFFQGAAKLANALKALGVSTGDRVAVQVNKSPQALMLYAACVQSGAVFLPLNTAYTSEEVRYFVEDATPALVVCDGDDLGEYKTLFKQTTVVSLNQDGSGSLADKASEQPATFDVVKRSEEDLAAILYTSGTTGRSKGAMLTHKNLVSNAVALKELWQFNEDDVLLHALPIFHTHGLFVATNVTLAAGSAMIFLPGFSVDELIQYMPEATCMMGVPTFYTRLLADERFNKELVRNARLFISGSAPMLTDTHEAFYARTGLRILERYGMTETNMNASNPFDGERRAGTVGPAVPGVEIRVADADNPMKILPAGEVGSVQVKGPNVFKGYWNMPEKTQSEFTQDGFFITGDLGELSEDEYLTIVGRSKDLIISGGYNIYPKEIEVVIDELPGVFESAVFGVAHADFGEGVLAAVVKSANSDITESQIMSAIKEKLARFKHPRKIYFLDELPRNTMGKVQKNVLREQYKNELTEA